MFTSKVMHKPNCAMQIIYESLCITKDAPAVNLFFSVQDCLANKPCTRYKNTQSDLSY